MDFEEMIESLDEELNGRKGLFSKKINIEQCGELVTAIKNSYPDVMRESAYIVNNRNMILANADNAAQNTIKEAQERAGHIIGGSELMRRAETEAQKLIDSAQNQCNILVERTKEHLDKIFREIEQFLLSTINMVRTNRDELRSAVVMKNSKL